MLNKKTNKLLIVLLTCYLICTGATQKSFNEAFAIDENQKILVVALDNRPVNTEYPLYLAEKGKITISNSINKSTLKDRIKVIEEELSSGN